MGTMTFLLPPDLPVTSMDLLKSAALAGGFDNVPGPTQVRLKSRELRVKRPVDESGFLLTPWTVDRVGTVMVQTTTLIERDEPYLLSLEFLRGKLHHIRNQVAQWSEQGIDLSPTLVSEYSRLNRQFAFIMSQYPGGEVDRLALDLLSDAFLFADQSVVWVSEEQKKMRLSYELPPVALGCALSVLPATDELATRFDHFRLDLSWRTIEPKESHFDWTTTDAVVDWAVRHNIPLSAGPLINFSKIGIPDWLWIWQGDLANIAHFMCDYVETVVSRYRQLIRRWLVCTGCNVGGGLGFGEDELLWLTTRLLETVQQTAPKAELIVGVSQPWGDYMSRDEHTYSPLVFIDTLLRTHLKLGGIALEIIPGVLPNGSYWRDLLDTSRLLDSFAELGAPVEITLAIPASDEVDPLADPDTRVGAGYWGTGYSPEIQAERGLAFFKLAASKPFVTHVVWSHLTDSVPHRFPNCGLWDGKGVPRPVYELLTGLPRG